MKSVQQPLTAAKRCEILTAARVHAVIKVGALLKEAGVPKTYRAYEKMMKSLDLTIKHARTRRFKEEAGM